MRSLSLVFLFMATVAQAEPAQVDTKLTSTSYSGVPAVDFQGTSPIVSNYSSVVSVKSPGLLRDSVVLNASVTESKNDYSGTIITNADGAESPLSKTFSGPETSGELGAEWKSGGNTAHLSYGSMLSQESPYPFRAVTASYNYAFYDGATVLGSTLNWTQQGQPLTYYTDPRDFQVTARPAELHSERLELWVEQILTERWKGQLRVLGGERLEDRPPHLGAELRNSYALTDHLALRFDTGAISELRNYSLKDERGYYSVYWGELQAVYEIHYDFLITAAFGTTVERESVPWSGLRTQVGTDTAGLKLSYKGKSWTASLSGQSSFANTSYRAEAFQGDLQWDI